MSIGDDAHEFELLLELETAIRNMRRVMAPEAQKVSDLLARLEQVRSMRSTDAHARRKQ